MEKKERDFLKSDLETMKLTFAFLRMNLVCNMFIINNPEFNYIFPYRGNVGMLSGYLHHSKDILKLINNEKAEIKTGTGKDVQAHIKSLNKKADGIFKANENFENIDIRDKESFRKIYDYFYIMKFMYDKSMKSTNKNDFAPSDLPSGLLSIDATQKYFELIGYWTAKMEDKAKKRNSGKGQKDAQEERVNELTDKIKTFVDDFSKDTIDLDKGLFIKLLSETFTGAEEYPRHPQTIKTYKGKIENSLNIKLNLTKTRGKNSKKVPF